MKTITYNATPSVEIRGLKRSIEVPCGTARADGPHWKAKDALRREVEGMEDEELAEAVREAFRSDPDLDVRCRKVRE